jgi:hypothetical protein
MSICPIELTKQCDKASRAVETLLSTLMRDEKFTLREYVNNVDRLVSISVGLNAFIAEIKATLEEESEDN